MLPQCWRGCVRVQGPYPNIENIVEFWNVIISSDYHSFSLRDRWLYHLTSLLMQILVKIHDYFQKVFNFFSILCFSTIILQSLAGLAGTVNACLSIEPDIFDLLAWGQILWLFQYSMNLLSCFWSISGHSQWNNCLLDQSVSKKNLIQFWITYKWIGLFRL